MNSFRLSGLWVPLVTPFHGDGSLDLVSLDRVGRAVLADGAAGIIALGTTGEPATLDAGERRQVIECCSTLCTDLARPLIVGVGTNSTRSTLEAAVALSRTPSLEAVLVVTPYYTRPSLAGIVQHYAAVAEQSPVPIVAYNVPYRTGVALNSETLLDIAALPNVIGLKQSVGALDADTLHVLRGAPPSFSVMAGDDAFIAPTLLMGGAGAISAAAHMCTNLFTQLVETAKGRDMVTARRLAELLLPVVTAGFQEPSPAVWKAALHVQGLISSPTLRAPLTAATLESTERLVGVVESALRQSR